VPAVIGAAISNASTHGWATGVGDTLAGLVVGCGLLLLPFAAGAMGAGDVKLLGALGAWIGSIEVLNVFVYSALAGALWALLILVRNKSLQSAIKRLWKDMVWFQAAGRLRFSTHTGATMPYAVAIAAGYMVFLLYGRFI
jgi:prepilin peptidase CpaA